MSRADRVRAALGASRQRLAAEYERFGEADFTRRPSPGAWSAGHVAEHLTRVDQNVARGIGAALAGKLVIAPRWTDPFTRLVYFSNLYKVVRVRTAPAMDPAESAPRAEALAKLAAARAALVAAVEDGDSRGLWSHRLRHPIFGPLPMADMLRFVSDHEDRHRMQLGRIREGLGLAGSPAA